MRIEAMKNPMIKVAVKFAKKALGTCKTPNALRAYNPEAYFAVNFSSFTLEERAEAVAMLKASEFYKKSFCGVNDVKLSVIP